MLISDVSGVQAAWSHCGEEQPQTGLGRALLGVKTWHSKKHALYLLHKMRQKNGIVYTVKNYFVRLMSVIIIFRSCVGWQRGLYDLEVWDLDEICIRTCANYHHYYSLPWQLPLSRNYRTGQNFKNKHHNEWVNDRGEKKTKFHKMLWGESGFNCGLGSLYIQSQGRKLPLLPWERQFVQMPAAQGQIYL